MRRMRRDDFSRRMMREIVEAEQEIESAGLPADAEGLRALKMLGFTDARLAGLTGQSETDVRKARRAVGVNAVFKRIDTCAAEFEAQTPYMYSTYEEECEAEPTDNPKIMKALLKGKGAIVMAKNEEEARSLRTRRRIVA